MIRNKYFKVGLFNAGSLNTGQEELIVAMSQVLPDLMAINECFLRAGQEDRAPVIPGYRLWMTPRPNSVRRGWGGGVGFYIRKGINVSKLSHPISEPVEQLWLRVKLNNRQIVVGTAYRPQWLNVDDFFEAVTESVVSLSPYDGIILVGDFNIDLLQTTACTGKFHQFLQSLSLYQSVTVPTHFTHTQTLIDLICSDSVPINVHVKHSPDLGHHAMVSADFKFKCPQPVPRWVIFRPLKDILPELWCRDLEGVNWGIVHCMRDVDEMVSWLNCCFQTLFDLHAPIKRRRFRHPPHPWITDTIKSIMRIRDDYHNKFRQSQTLSSKSSYLEMKNLVIHAIENEKKAYFKNNINSNIKNPKILWKNLKNTISPNRDIGDLPPQFDNPDTINAHFLDIPGAELSSISLLSYFEFHRHCLSSEFSLSIVSEDLVLKLINNLKSNAMGVDGISLEMLYLTLPQSLSAITAIINTSISSGVFPTAWKTAVIKPIPKNKQPCSVKDLRPISLLPCLSKILERVVFMQLSKFIEDNNILPNRQSGFRKGYSTATALLDVVDSLLGAQDQGKVSVLLLLDYSRAFECINTSLLLSKLAYYGLDMKTLHWFDSYLRNRQQYVELTKNDGTRVFSAPRAVTRGVPQGSILGPLLFIIYCADLPHAINHCDYHSYADDLQLHLSFHPSEYLAAVDRVNDDLINISNWSKANGLALNPNKTKFLVLGSRSRVQRMASVPLDIQLDNIPIERVMEARNLGLLMDENLRFEGHIAEYVRNCFYRLKVLYKIRQYLSTDLRIALCESLVLSKLNYCNTVFGPCILGKTMKLIQRVQNACARFTFSIPPRTHVTPYLCKQKILKMEERHKLHFACLMFGIVKLKKPAYLYDKLTWADDFRHFSSRPGKHVLNWPRHHSVAFRGAFRYAAAGCWNDIPPPLRALKTVVQFRKQYKAVLLQKQISHAAVTYV